MTNEHSDKGSDTKVRPNARRSFKNWQEMRKSFYALLQDNPKLQYALYAIIIVIVLLLYFGLPWKEKNTNEEQEGGLDYSTNPDDQQQDLEARLTRTLEKIQGAGKVEVMISYASSSELVPAMSVDKQEQTGISEGSFSERESSQPYTVQGETGEGPIVLMQIEPQIRGVIVVAEGADDIAVKMKLMNAAQVALDIPSSKVEVFEMSRALEAEE